ncbi:MAG: aspartate kinase [Alicyclobacillaceae bacterium]|nr:aspartate kinase [Alicyclobacillaceae bacterium]
MGRAGQRRTIVQKYGGTSVGSVERVERVADRIAETVRNGHRVAVVVSAMGHSTDALVDLAKQIMPIPVPRELDALLATGEQVSAALLAMALCKRGMHGVSLTGWQVPLLTDEVHGAAHIDRIVGHRIETLLEAGDVPVLCGFQGIASGDVTTLGRGGSDTTAVALAAHLRADVCEIYTDVRGVFTTDPRVVSDARKLPCVLYDEMLELAGLGAQVLHPRAVEVAKHFGVPLVVKSTFESDGGTEIVSEIEDDGSRIEGRESVTGIAFLRDVAKVVVVSLPLEKHGLAVIFGALASERINVDVIVQSVVTESDIDLSFTVQEDDALRTLNLVQSLQDRLGFRDVVLETGLGKVSIVGAGMISNPGVAAEMFGYLADASIPIRMVSTSEIKVSCIIAADLVDTAVQALHASFFTAIETAL